MLVARPDPAFIFVSRRGSTTLFDGESREQERIGFYDVGTHDPALADPDIAGHFPAFDAFGADQFYI
ncbi:hypothetical protein D3C86_2243310 [compost metagenome]